LMLSPMMVLPLLYLWISPEEPPAPMQVSWRGLTPLAIDKVLFLPNLGSEPVTPDKAA